MSADSSWLAAYEAQKAAVLQKMNATKSAPAGPKPTPSGRNSVSGSSEFSGLVNIDHVKHLSKSTQITKIMDNLKKHNNQAVHKPPQQPPFRPSVAGPNKSTFSKPPPTAAASNSPNFSKPPPQHSAFRPSVATTKSPGFSKPPPQQGSRPSLANRPAFGNSSQTATTSSPWNSSAAHQPPSASWSSNSSNHMYPASASVNSAVPKSSLGSGGQSKSKKKKKGSQEEGVAITDLFKRVKCDSNRNSGDWAQEYEKRKKETIDNIVSGNVETRVGSMSAFHAGPLAEDETTTSRNLAVARQKPKSAAASSVQSIKPPPPPKALIQNEIGGQNNHRPASKTPNNSTVSGNPKPQQFEKEMKRGGHQTSFAQKKPNPSPMSLNAFHVPDPPSQVLPKTNRPVPGPPTRFGQNSSGFTSDFGLRNGASNTGFKRSFQTSDSGQAFEKKSRFEDQYYSNSNSRQQQSSRSSYAPPQSQQNYGSQGFTQSWSESASHQDSNSWSAPKSSGLNYWNYK